MNKQKLQTLKGFRDFFPAEAKKRKWLKKKMIKVFESWGYQPIETPALEYLELFEGEIGEDEKLFYQFTDLGGREVALRYDQTVPTCRFIGENFQKLTFPFRRYQIQSVWRAEKPQKGRYREFVQSDIDIFGISSPLADAEAIALSLDLYQKLGFEKVIVKVNNRDLMKNIPYKVIASIDKLEKIGSLGVIEDMVNKGINKNQAEKYLNKIDCMQPDETIFKIFSYLRKTGFDQSYYQFDPTLARAFSYSQGPIWEIVVPEYAIGSVGGGERYDDLVERITGRQIPATGIAFGFDRTLEALEELELIPEFGSTTQVLVTVFNQETFSASLQTAQKLRRNRVNTEVYPSYQENISDQLNYANEQEIPWVIVIGPEEVENNTVALKNMASGKQKQFSVQEVVNKLA
jgi:histidyl-tRNA synthetase